MFNFIQQIILLTIIIKFFNIQFSDICQMGKKDSSSKIYSQEEPEVSHKQKKQEKIKSNSRGGSCCKFLECIMFIVISCMLLMPLIFELGTDQVLLYSDSIRNETNQNEKINNVNLYKEIKEKKYVKIMVDKQEQIDIVQLIKSSIQRFKTYQYQSLTIRNYNDPYSEYRYAFKQVKKFINQNFFSRFEQFVYMEKVQNTWLLIGLDSQIPNNDVKQIKQQLPGDEIVIVTNKSNAKYKQFSLLQVGKFREQKIDIKQQEEIKISQQSKLQELISQINVLMLKISQKYEYIQKKQQERLNAQKLRNINQEKRQKSQQNRVQSIQIKEKKGEDQQKYRLQLDRSLKSVIELNNKLSTIQHIKESLDQILANQKTIIPNEEKPKQAQKSRKTNKKKANSNK